MILRLLFLHFITLGLILPFSKCLANVETLILTELMINPQSVSDTNGEWMEILNNSAQPINLKDCEIIHKESRHPFLTEKTIQPKEYLVLCRNNNPLINGGLICDYQYSGISLSNVLGKVGISCDQIEIVFDYSGEMVTEGISLELNKKGFFSLESYQDQKNWLASTKTMPNGDLGSPGQENPPRPETIVANEASPVTPSSENKELVKNNNEKPSIIISESLPNPQEADNESNEFLELYNQENRELSLADFHLQNKKGDKYFFNQEDRLGPLSYLVIYREKFKFNLYNESGEISLFYQDKLIDSLIFSGGAPSGKSLNKNSSLETYWSATITPGKENAKMGAEIEPVYRIKDLEKINDLPNLTRVSLKGESISPSGIPQKNSFYLQRENWGILIKTDFELFLKEGEFLKIEGIFHKSIAGNYLEVEAEEQLTQADRNPCPSLNINDHLHILEKGNCLKVFLEGILTKKSTTYFYFELDQGELIRAYSPPTLCLNSWKLETGKKYRVRGVLEQTSTGPRIILVDQKAINLLNIPLEKEITIPDKKKTASPKKNLSSPLLKKSSPYENKIVLIKNHKLTEKKSSFSEILKNQTFAYGKTFLKKLFLF